MADDTSTQAAEEPVKKKSKKGLILAVAGVLVLAIGGAAGYVLMQPAEAASEASEELPPEEELASVVAFEPFTVNLADGGGAQFLRISVQLVVSGEDTADLLDEDAVTSARLRSELLEILAEHTASTLVTPEGKETLKATIADRAEPILDPHKVLDVLFTEFIVQF